MGFRPELYTKEYFTGMDAQGQALAYGVEGFHEWQQGKIRDSLVSILSCVPTKGKRILEMGYGRGESIKYYMMRGASGYVGVDFSEAAYELAKEANHQHIHAGFGKPSVEVHLGDGLSFMRKNMFREEFDVVVMLDVIEHIPTTEVAELLPMLYSALKPGGYCLADTPFYRVDEDFIAQGFEFKDPSPSDLIPQTHGMHCNKFTKGRLFSEMKNCGFLVEGNFCFQKPGVELAAWLRAVA